MSFNATKNSQLFSQKLVFVNNVQELRQPAKGTGTFTLHGNHSMLTVNIAQILSQEQDRSHRFGAVPYTLILHHFELALLLCLG